MEIIAFSLTEFMLVEAKGNAPSVCTTNFAKRDYDVIEIQSKVRRIDANRENMRACVRPCVRASVRPCVRAYVCICAFVCLIILMCGLLTRKFVMVIKTNLHVVNKRRISSSSRYVINISSKPPTIHKRSCLYVNI